MLRKGSLTQLCDELERQKKNSMDLVVRSEAITATPVSGEMELTVPNPKDPAIRQGWPLTRYAHEQLAEKMGIPLKYYDKMQDADKYALLAENINAWMQGKEKRLLRILDGHVRAILSDRYRPIDNYDLLWVWLDALKHEKEDGQEIEIFQCDISETRMYIKAKLPAIADLGEGDKIQAMLMLVNSEVGASRLTVALGLWREWCKNGAWTEDIVSKVHLGQKLEAGLVDWSMRTLKKTDEALFSQIRDTIRAGLDPQLWHQVVAKVEAASNVELEAPISEIVDLVSPAIGLGEGEKKKLLDLFAEEIGTPAGKTQWGLANAVTRLARDTDHADRQMELETIGGDLINRLPPALDRLVPARLV